MKKKWIIGLAIVGLLLTAGLGACKHGYRSAGFDAFDLAAVTNRIAYKLDLTETQKADLEQIAAEIMAKAKAMHADREVRMQRLADRVRQDTIDKAVVDEAIDKKLLNMRELADLAAERLIAFHGTLTPEQREKIATHIEAHADGGCQFGFH